MMTLEYEQSLVETTVFLAVRDDRALDCAFHLAIDPLYEIPDEELRQREFAPVFREFFTKLELDRVIAGLLAERPLVGERVDQCIVREAARKKAESAELFLPGGDDEASKRTIVIQVCPQSLVEPERFAHRMRRELLHVADMLDERFGYRRETFAGPVSLQNLQRDRYRVLWDTYVEGRMSRESLGTGEEEKRLRCAFARAMPHDAEYDSSLSFRYVFDASVLTHSQFMAWAKDPDRLFETSRR